MTWRISTDIPHGNAANAKVVFEDGVPTVQFAAHPHGGTETLWWCFRLWRDEGDGEDASIVRLAWRHFDNCLGLSSHSAPLVHPVVRRDHGPWERLPGGQVRDPGNGCPVVFWETEAPAQWLEAAFCFPHGLEQVEVFAHKAGWHCDAIGISSHGRELIRVANDYGAADRARPGIYCVAHQHASEMSGAWALQGFLEEMARQGAAAPLVWSAPLVNVDGVVEGDYGKDPFPWDLNRAWGQPPMRAEALVCMRDIERWRSRCRPVLCLDFHSPGGAEHEGVYTFLFDPQINSETYAMGEDWSDAISGELADLAAVNFKRVATYPSRFKTDQHSTFSKFYCQDTLLGMTFEVPYHRIAERLLSVDDYLEIGRRMAVAVGRKIRL